MQALETRIHRLERANRRLRFFLVLIVAAAAAVPLMGAGDSNDDLVKRREKRERAFKNNVVKAHEETYARLPREYRQTLFDATHKILAGTEITPDELQLVDAFNDIPEINDALRKYLHNTAVKTGYYEFLRGFGGELQNIKPIPIDTQ